MKEYYPSKNRLFVVFMPAAMLFLLAFNTFSLNNIAALSVSLVTFGVLGYGLFILFKRMSRPILVIENSKITVNTWFSNNVITDLEQCKLIISRDLSITSDFQGIVLYEPYFIKYPDIKSLFSNALSFVRRY